MTSINYLVKEFSEILGALTTQPIQDLLLVDAINKAKEMHKQEIIDAAERWKGTDFAERYYQETFVSKGSDDHISDISKMVEDDVEKLKYKYFKNEGFMEGYDYAKETLYTEEQVQKMIDDAFTNYELGWADRRKQQNLYTEKEIRKAIYGNPKFIFGKDQAEAIIQSLKQPKK